MDPVTQREAVELLRFLSRLGHALLATGEMVGVIEDMLRRLAQAWGVAKVSVVALPTVLFVKLDNGEVRVDFTSEKALSLRFDQIEAVFMLASDAQRLAVSPREGLARLDAILAQPPCYGAAWRVGGHVLVTVGIAIVLQPTAGVVGSAALLGLVVGGLRVLARNGTILNTLLPTIAAFLVAAIALLAAEHGWPASPLRVLIAALVTFLPGGVLAVATMELAYGDMISGASRFVMGLVQLIFLMLGMIAAVSLTGLPTSLLATGSMPQLGSWAPWLGVPLFGIGLVLHYSSPLRTLPWVLLVLFIGTAGQILGNALFGGYMSGFVGSLLVTAAAYLVQYRLGGPPAMITFLPGLWLLVPGSIALIGLAELVSDNRLAGLDDFVTTLFSIVAVAVGSLIGSWIYGALFDPIFRSAGSMAEFMRSHLRARRK
jgi:uncharacterized membrane protein YjjP (DUF1212 family)